jgi:hypothetical protein
MPASCLQMHRDGFAAGLPHLSRVPPRLMSIRRCRRHLRRCRLHLRKHRALAIGVLSLAVGSQRREIWPRRVVSPRRCSEHCRAMVLIPLLLLMLMMHARCVGIRDRAWSRRFRTCPDVSVRARCAKGLAEATAVLLLRQWVVRRLIRRLVARTIGRRMLIHWLHVSFISHHAQMCAVTRCNAWGVGKLILEFLWGLMYSSRPFWLLLLLARRWKWIGRLLICGRCAWAL